MSWSVIRLMCPLRTCRAIHMAPTLLRECMFTRHHHTCTRQDTRGRHTALTCLFQICKGFEPMLYMMERNPDWYAFLNIVDDGLCATHTHVHHTHTHTHTAMS